MGWAHVLYIGCLILLNIIVIMFAASFYRTFLENHVYNNKLFIFLLELPKRNNLN